MFWRESRHSLPRLIVFALPVAFGISAIVSILSLGVVLGELIERESKGLVGADLVIERVRSFTKREKLFLDSISYPKTTIRTFQTTVRFDGQQIRSALVKAIDGTFPFYGEAETAPRGAFAQLRPGIRAAIVEEYFFRASKLRVGDSITIGAEDFVVVGSVKRAPGDNIIVFRAHDPRIYVQTTPKLVALATRARFELNSVLFQLPNKVRPEEIVEDLQRRFPNVEYSVETVRVRIAASAKEVAEARGFLSLIGFIALGLGAIGLGASVHIHVQKQIKSVAVLRCLGATQRESFSIYLLQGAVIAGVATVAGCVLGVVVQRVLPSILHEALLTSVPFRIVWPSVLASAATGFTLAMLLALLPLLRIRDIQPAAVLQCGADAPPLRVIDSPRAAAALGIIALLLVFSVWQTEKPEEGISFVAYLVASVLLLAGMAVAMAKILRRVTRVTVSFELKQGIANLHRPNNRTGLLLLTLGISIFLGLATLTVKRTVLRSLEPGGTGRPDVVIGDIASEYLDTVLMAVREVNIARPIVVPVVDLQIAREKEGTPDGNREPFPPSIPATFRDHLDPSEHLITGNFAGRATSGVALVPIAVREDFATQHALKVGSVIRWEIENVPVQTWVSGIYVDWNASQAYFPVIFPAGVIDNAPHDYMVAMNAGREAGARLREKLNTALPHLLVLDFTPMLEAYHGVMRTVLRVIQFMTVYVGVTAFAILICVLAASRFQRAREVALLRTLGATWSVVRGVQLTEYAALGAVAAVVGVALTYPATELIARYILKADNGLSMLDMLATGAAGTAMAIATGLIANRRNAQLSPLEILRMENS